MGDGEVGSFLTNDTDSTLNVLYLAFNSIYMPYLEDDPVHTSLFDSLYSLKNVDK